MSNNISKQVNNWTFILYPESAVSNWRLGLEGTRKGYIISPLHNKDVNEKGELKKAHWHIVLSNPRGMTYNTVLKISSMLGGTRPEPVINEKGMIQYLTHENDENKIKYHADDIEWGNGLTPEMFEERSNGVSLADLFAFIRDNDIDEYSILVDSLCTFEMFDMLAVAVEKAFAIQTYLRSRKCNRKECSNDRSRDRESDVH